MLTSPRPRVGFRCLATGMLVLLGQAVVAGAEPTKELNVPPPGFTALFNGKDFTGWRMSPKAKAYWTIEDDVLKSPGLLKEWGADLQTEKAYRDFVLLLEFRMPTISDSGIMDDILGKMNPCPIEYRNIFIKELESVTRNAK